MKKIKPYFLIAIYAFVIEILTFPLRGGYCGMDVCALVTFLLYFVFMNLILKRYALLKSRYILYASLIGCSILRFPIHIFDFESAAVSLPDFLFHLFGILMGYLFYKFTQIYKIVILTLSVSACLFLYVKGYDMWLHKLNFGTFTGRIDDIQQLDLVFQTNAGDTISLSDFKGKYVLIDCWYTSCSVCYKKMPAVQNVYDKYKANDQIVVGSMHSYMKEEKNENYLTGSEILKERHYTFPCWAIDIENPALKDLGVDGYPTVLIFDRQSNLIFRGSIENAEKLIEKRLKVF